MHVLRSVAFAVVVSCPAILVSMALAQTETPTPAEPPAAAEAPAPAEAEAAEVPAEGEAETAEGEDDGPVEFTAAFLEEEAVLASGKEVWELTCQSCHGAKAYPGKAPKLKPSRYTPEFVFDRVTNGFRKMPGWKDVFTKEERMAVSAYVMSRKFSP